MKVITNEAIIAKRKKWANILAPAAMILLLAGLAINILSLRSDQITPIYFYATLTLLMLGFLGSSISTNLINRWVKEPRADQILGKALNGFDNRHILLNYTTSQTPHILITQNKVYAITTKSQKGQITVTNNKWKREFSFGRFIRFFADEALGNPTQEAKFNTNRLVALLRERLTEDEYIPVEPVILFTNPDVDLTVNGSEVPVMTGGKFKNFVRDGNKGGAIKAEVRQKLVEILSNQPAG